MKALEVIDKVKALIEPELASRGVEVVEVEYRREPVGMVLRLFIDHPDGIDLDRCAEASNAVSDMLDNEEIVPGEYTLEVSSPGIERRLTRPEHYKRFVGSEIAVKRSAPREGRKKWIGVLREAGDDGFVLEADGGAIEFKYADVAKANLVFKV